MNHMKPFDARTMEQLARILAECGTGSQISLVLDDCKLEDNSGEGTKWKRLYWVFNQSQRNYKSPNQILNFIKSFLSLSGFMGRREEFELRRSELNGVLSIKGLKYTDQCEFVRIEEAKTLEEAERHAQKVRRQFSERIFHPKMLISCGDELAKEDYYHAVFEAVKGLAQRVRDESEVQLDGAELIDKVFSVKKPILAFNKLETESEKSEHKGLAMLLKGCISAVRNPRAHTPKIRGNMDDATDLALVSLLHQKLDSCHKVNYGNIV